MKFRGRPIFRSLYFSDPPRERAEAIYLKYHSGGVPSSEDYRTFQDYVFRVMIDQAGKLNLPVHFHSAVGIGDYFSLRNGNPLNLENVLRDPRYAKTKFVLIHGGYPYTLGNDLADRREKRLHRFFSGGLLRLSLGAQEYSEAMDFALSRAHDVRFRTPSRFNEAVGAEETFWLAARSARTAVARALAELVAEGAFTEEKAVELARMYLHDNAAHLYGGAK